MDRVHRLLCAWGSPGESPGGFLLQGIFPTRRSNLGLPHCGRALHHLSRLGRPLHQLDSNSSPPSPQSSTPSFFLLFLWFWVFHTFPMDGTVQYLSFCNWLISHIVIPSRFFQVISRDTISLCPWLDSIPFHTHRTWHITSLSSMYQWRARTWVASAFCEYCWDRHGAQRRLWDPALNWGCIPSSESTGWLFEASPCCLPSACTISRFHPQYTKVPAFPHLWQ